MLGLADRSRFRGGLLPRRTFLALLAPASLLGPLLVFRDAVRDPLERIPCGRATPNEQLCDPVIILSVMGRAWARWDVGNFSRRDDRVFAPYPDTSILGEPWLVPALIGCPWSRVAASDALGYNVPYLLAAAVACFAAGLLLAGLAGAGWPALVGGVLWAWCPGHLNNFGVIGSLWAGFVPLALLFALRYLRAGRPRDAVAASVSLAVVGLGSSSPLAMGSVVMAIVAVLSARSLRRLLSLWGAPAVSLGGFVLLNVPCFRAAKEFDLSVGARLLEAQSADLLSVLHTFAGRPLFAGPYRVLAEVPGFNGLRGLNRWDQWFGLGLVVAATLLLGRLLRATRPRRGLAVMAGLAPLLVLDLWTRPVPSQAFPGPSPFDAWYEELPTDATVAVFPLLRVTADRTWAEQLHHGRRVVSGYQTFPPPIHGWLTFSLSGAPFETTYVVFTEPGASAVEVDLTLVPAMEAARIEGLLRAGVLPRVRGVVRSPSRFLVLTKAVAPVIVASGNVSGLSFVVLKPFSRGPRVDSSSGSGAAGSTSTWIPRRGRHGTSSRFRLSARTSLSRRSRAR